MNKIYKVIWSNAKKCYVVVSEIAKNHGKNNTKSILSQFAARSLKTGRLVLPLVAAGLLLQSAPAWATEIKNVQGVVDQNGKVYNVYTQRVIDNTIGMNQFEKFNVDNGHIANMHFNQKGQAVSVNSLVNLVNNRISINGTVNAVRNGKIDGDLYFLSPNGMAVGATGVINAGKFVALAPSSSYFNELWNSPERVAAAVKDDFAKFGTRIQGGDDDGKFVKTNLELNGDADKGIQIQGKINTRSGIVLGAGTIAIQNGAVLKSKRDIDFNNLVNTSEAGLSGDLNVKSDASGDIILHAETSHKFSNSPILLDSVIGNGLSNVSEYVDSLTNINSSASVAVDGDISGDGNVNISAVSTTTFTNKDWPGIDGMSELLKEMMSNAGVNVAADFAVKHNTASVAINNTGKVSAGGAANLEADAVVKIEMQAKTASMKDPTVIENPAAGNPGQTESSSAVPVFSVGVVHVKNKALVDIKGALSSGGDMDLKASADTLVDMSAMAATKKNDGDHGNSIYLASSLLFGDSIAEVNVDALTDNNQEEKLKAGGAFKAGAVSTNSVAVEAISAGTNETFSSTAVSVLDYDSAANVNLKRSVEAASVTVNAENKFNSLGISADNSHGEGSDPMIDFKVSGKTNIKVLADAIKKKLGNGFRQGGKLQGLENAFDNVLSYVTVGAAVGVVDSTNTANVVIAPGVELKASGNKDAAGNVSSAGDVKVTSAMKMNSSYHSVTGKLNKPRDDAGSAVNVAAAVLVSNIDNDAAVELQSGKGKGVTLTAPNGTIVLSSNVHDNDSSMNSLRGATVSDLWDKIIKDFEAVGKDTKKLTEWKNKTVQVLEQSKDGTITQSDAATSMFNIAPAVLSFLGSEVKNGLNISNDTKKLISALSDYLSPASYTNYYVRSYTVDGQNNAGSNYDLAASVNVAKLESKGIVAIGENSVLKSGKDIKVLAESDLDSISGTGNAGEWLAYSETNGTGIGASFAWQDISADSIVLAGKNVSIQAGTGAGSGQSSVTLDSKTVTDNYSIILSAGKADRSGLAGSVNIQDGGSNSLVLVDDEASITADGKVYLHADNKMNVANVVGGLALGSSKSMATVGAGLALNRLDENTLAVIGDNGSDAGTDSVETDTKEFKDKNEEEQNEIKTENTLAKARKLTADRADIRKMDRNFTESKTASRNLLGTKTAEGAAKGSITGSGITVNTASKGTVNAVTVEGVSNSENHAAFDTVNNWNKKANQAKSEITESLKNIVGYPASKVNKKLNNGFVSKTWNFGNYQPVQPNNDAAENSFNAAVAGSISWNSNHIETASVIDRTNLTLRDTGGSLKNEATDEMFTGAWAGAAAMNWFTGAAGGGVESNHAAHKGALGAAVALNSIEHDVRAVVRKTDIKQAGLIENTAINKGAEVAAALGLAVTKDSEGTGVNGGVAFGLSMNRNNGDVHSLLIDDTVTNTNNNTNITVSAYDGDIQVAGGVDFAFANSAEGGKALAAGITAAVSEIGNDIQSGIQGGSYTGIKDIKIAGDNALTQVNAAVAMGVTANTENSIEAAASLAYSELENRNHSFINGTSEINATGDVSVSSRDISGNTEQNPYVSYLKNRKVDATGNSYLTDEMKNKLGKESGSTIVNVAVEATGGSGASLGAAVAIGNVTNKFAADITNNKNLKADSVQGNADVHTNIVSVAVGASVSTKYFGGTGSLSFNNLDQDNIVSVSGNRDGSKEDRGIEAKTVSGSAKNTSHIVNVTGDFAGGKNALGLGVAYNLMDDTTGVYFSKNRIRAKDAKTGTAVSLKAENEAYALALSLGAAATYKDEANLAAHGNFGVNRGHNDTVAVIGEDKDGKKASVSDDRDVIKNASSVKVEATDSTSKTSIAGDVNAAVKDTRVALGAGVALTDIGKDSENNAKSEKIRAEIYNTDITAAEMKNSAPVVSTIASDTSKATTTAVGIGITKKSVLGAQLVMADAEINKITAAGLTDTNIYKNAAADTKAAGVTVSADTKSELKTVAGALQLSGSESFLTGVAAVAVNRINDTTKAGVSYKTKPSSVSMNVGNLSVSAASGSSITSVAAGVSGTLKGTAAAGGSGSYNYIENNVSALLQNANVESGGNVGVVAQSDEAISNFAGILDVNLGGKGAAVAIGVSASNNKISGATEALIENSTVTAKGSSDTDKLITTAGKLNGDDWTGSDLNEKRVKEKKTGVVVDASATHFLSSTIANGGLAVSGDSSVASVAAAGLVNVNTVSGKTTAKILDSDINSAATRSNVTVNAADYTNAKESGGAVAVGVAGQVGVAVGFNGSFNSVDRVTAAGISTGKAVWDKTKKQYVIQSTAKNLNSVFADDLNVKALSRQIMSGVNVAGAIAGSEVVSFQTGDNVNCNTMDSSTVAIVTNTTLDFKKNADVKADHEDRIYTRNVDAGIAASIDPHFVAASLNLGVGTLHETSAVTANVENSIVKSATENSALSVGAANSTTEEATLVSVGAAVSLLSGAAAGSGSVNNMDTVVTSRISGSELTADSIDVATENKLKVNDKIGTGAGALLAGIGAGVGVNTFNDTVSTVIDNSSLHAKKALTVSTGTQREIDGNVSGAGAGVAGVAVNVLAVTVNSGLGDTAEVKDNKGGTYNRSEIVQKVLDKINKNTAQDLSEHFHGLTDAEKKEAKEKIKIDAKNGNGIKGTGVHTYVTNNSTLEAKKGALSVTNQEYTDGDIVGGSYSGGLASINVSDVVYHQNRQNDIAIQSSTVTADSITLSSRQDNRTDTADGFKARTYQVGAGALGIGVGYAGITAKGVTGVQVDKSTLKAENGDLTVQSVDTAKSRARIVGVTVGAIVGVGVSNAGNEDLTSNYVTVSGGSALSAKKADTTETVDKKDENGNVIKDANGEAVKETVTVKHPASVLLQTTRTGGVAAKTTGVGVGAVEVVVNNGTATDESNSSVSVTGSGNSFSADLVRMEAGNAPTVKAEAGGTDAALLGISSMVSKARAESKATVSVANDNELLGDAVLLQATVGTEDSVMTHAETHGTSATAISVNPNYATAVTKTRASVKVGNETYKTVKTDNESGEEKTNVTSLAVISKNNASRKAIVGNTSIGLALAVGIGNAEAKGEDYSVIQAAGGDVKSLKVSADGSSKAAGYADGDSGGAFSFADPSTITTDTYTVNTATLSGTWNVTDTADIGAVQNISSKASARTGTGGIVSVNWAKSDNNVTADTKAALARGAVLNAGKSYMLAENTITTGAWENDKYNNHMNMGGVFNFAPDVKSTSVVNAKAYIDIGKNSKVTTARGQVYDAHNTMDLSNQVEGKGGGVAENMGVHSVNTTTETSKIIVSKGAVLEQKGKFDDGDLIFSSSDNLKLKSLAEAWVGGFEGALFVDAENTINRNNQIEIDGTVSSTHDINLYAGADADGSNAQVDLTGIVESHNNTVIPLKSKPSFTYNLTNNHHVSVGSDASVTSVRNINITADSGSETVTKDTKEVAWLFLGADKETGVATNSPGNSQIKETDNNYVNVEGTLQSGSHNKVSVDISGSAIPEISGATPVDTQKAFTVDTTGSNENFNKNDIKTGNMDYATQLGTQLKNVEALIKEYSTGTDSKSMASYLGYVQQRQRILDEMEKRGLFETVTVDGKTQKVYKTSGITVRYVEIPEITASGGNIVVQSDTLYGKGTLKANGTPQVTINNYSNAYLKLDGIRIGETGGEIRFQGSNVVSNADVNKLNKNKSQQASFGTFQNDTAGGKVSAITVTNENKAGTSIKMRDSAGKTVTYNPVTDVAVLGNLTNDSGDVRITNTSGSITISSGSADTAANIIGRMVQLKARDSISQDYVDGIVNIGGRPQDLNAEEVRQAIDKASQNALKDKTKLVTSTESGLKETASDISKAELGRIAGESIYISAADINVNGLIQSGYSKYEADIPKDALSDSNLEKYKNSGNEVTIQGRTMYKVNDGGKAVYDQDTGAFKYIVQVFYDPAAKNLVVEDIDTKGGKVYLTGRISSTGNGKVLAVDGGADISITNRTSAELSVGKVINNNLEGKITITDLAKDTWTEYTRTSTKSIENYSRYAKNSAEADKQAKVTAGIGYNKGAEAAGTYKVKEGLRYNWTLGTETGTTKFYHKKQNTLFWGGINTSSNESMRQMEQTSEVKEVNSGSTRDLSKGNFIDTINDAEYGKKINSTDFGAIYENRVTNETRTVTGKWKESGHFYLFWSDPTYHMEWNTKTGSSQSYTFSLKADRDIGIGFIGKENGSISIQDTNIYGRGIKLTDDIKNNSAGATLSVHSTGGAITQSGDAPLVTGQADLRAYSNIDNIHITSMGTRTANSDGSYTASDNVKLSAVSDDGGDVNVKVTGGTADGQLLPGNVEIQKLESVGTVYSSYGYVTLEADGNITQNGKDTTVKGTLVTLRSANGGIGTGNQAVVIDKHSAVYGYNPEKVCVDAEARKDIYLTKASGDMRIKSVVSREGDVTLTANSGRLLDALSQKENTNNLNESELVKHWIDTGLIAGTSDYEGAYISGLKKDAADYAARVKEQYALYAAGGEVNEQIKALFTNEDGTKKYASADEYLAKDAAYQAIVKKYKEPTYKWTKEQLLYSIRNAIVNKESGVTAETQSKPANVQGRNVTLNARGVGMNQNTTTTILAEDITGGSDTAVANLKKLANADAADVTMLDAQGNILTYTTDASGKQVVKARDAKGNEVKTDGKIYSFVIGNLSPLGVKATGKVDVSANGENVFIAGRSDSSGKYSPINVGVISTGSGSEGSVRLYTQEGIYNALDAAGNGNRANIKASDLIAYGGTKDIGAKDNYLKVDLAGELLTAAADGNIYIKNVRSDVLRVGSLFAGNTLALDSVSGYVKAANKEYANAYLSAGKELILSTDPVSGMIGEDSENKYIQILNNGTPVNIAAGEAYIRGVKGLQGEDTTMRLAAVSATRSFVADSEGNMDVSGNLKAGTGATLRTRSGGNLLVSGTIDAGSVTLGVWPGDTVNGKNGNLVVEGNVTSMNSVNLSNNTKEGGVVITGNVTGKTGNVNINSLGGNVSVTGKLNAEKQSIEVDSKAGNIALQGDIDAKQKLSVKSGGDGRIILYKEVDEEMNIHTGSDISLEVENTDIVVSGKIISDGGSISAFSKNGTIGFIGDVRAAGNVNATVKQSGDIYYSGKVQAGGEVKAVTENGDIIYDEGLIEAGKNVSAEAGRGTIAYNNPVHAGRGVFSKIGTGDIVYSEAVSAGRNVEAYITEAGNIIYLSSVTAGRDVIARTAAGHILYGGSVDAGRSVIAASGEGSVSYMGRVSAGKDLPEQIRSGKGKIAYYDRYGLIGYSNSSDIVPVRNAKPEEVSIKK